MKFQGKEMGGGSLLVAAIILYVLGMLLSGILALILKILGIIALVMAIIAFFKGSKGDSSGMSQNQGGGMGMKGDENN